MKILSAFSGVSQTNKILEILTKLVKPYKILKNPKIGISASNRLLENRKLRGFINTVVTPLILLEPFRFQ